MTGAKELIDDIELAERLSRGWEEVYYGEEWPSEQECADDAERYPVGESFRPDSQA